MKLRKECAYVDLLKDELSARQLKNSKYSTSKFALDLGISKSFLSDVLSSRKNLSLKKANSILNSLKWSERQKHLFSLSVRAQSQTNSPQSEKIWNLYIEALEQYKKTETIKPETFSEVCDWMYLAALNLLYVNDFILNEENLSARLGLPYSLSKKIIMKLLKTKYIEKTNGEDYTPLLSRGETSSDVLSEEIQTFHRSILKKAGFSLKQPVESREFLSLMLSFKKDEILPAKKKLRQFAIDFTNEFAQDGHKDSVYQLSLQLFRIDLEPTEKKDFNDEYKT